MQFGTQCNWELDLAAISPWDHWPAIRGPFTSIAPFGWAITPLGIWVTQLPAARPRSKRSACAGRGAC